MPHSHKLQVNYSDGNPSLATMCCHNERSTMYHAFYNSLLVPQQIWTDSEQFDSEPSNSEPSDNEDSDQGEHQEEESHNSEQEENEGGK